MKKDDTIRPAAGPKFDISTLSMPPAWTEQALCAQIDTEMFFPTTGSTTKPAKSVCARCEVATQCLEWALANDERHGVYGGLSTNERIKIRDARLREAS